MEITTTTTFIEALIPKNCFELGTNDTFPTEVQLPPNCTLLLSDDLDNLSRHVVLLFCCHLVIIYLFIAVFVLLVWCGIF